LLVDLDGVVYRGRAALPHAVASLRSAKDAGLAIAFVTNNAARPPDVVAAHLRDLGLEVDDSDVVTSAQAGAREVAARVPAGSAVLAIGGPGVVEALRGRGFEVVERADQPLAAVVMGFGPDVSWRELAEASYAVEAGALFVATNTDASIPTARGTAPGNGTLVGAVIAATGRTPLVAGKPFAPLMRESIERVDARAPLVVGDRLDTDIEAGHVNGIPSLLVLTGVTAIDRLLDARPDHRPTFVSADLRGLSDTRAATPLGSPEPMHAHDDGLAGLRAACARSWAAIDAGRRSPVDLDERATLAHDVEQALR
jgi:HAD superfamily hydrolase (TIGR01450 family)